MLIGCSLSTNAKKGAIRKLFRFAVLASLTRVANDRGQYAMPFTCGPEVGVPHQLSRIEDWTKDEKLPLDSYGIELQIRAAYVSIGVSR
ncbi:hypothetical protein TNCV_4104491 [Trichonephila clavipes]|nr:hypothetical protein TNCV_4104491 [Trichonephila clavipes]